MIMKLDDKVTSSQVVLYGKTWFAEEAARQYPAMRILATCDARELEDDSYFLGLESSSGGGRPAVIFCKTLDVPLDELRLLMNRCHAARFACFDVYGKELARCLSDAALSHIEAQRRTWADHTFDDIKALIDAYDVVSFDIFDTLVGRTVSSPEDVFDLVENMAQAEGIDIEGFRKLRHNAQLESGLDNANLDEVYQELIQVAGVPAQEANHLKRLEIEAEKKVMVPKEQVIRLAEYAHNQGKEVILTTDMYLNEPYLVELLQNVGFMGYDDIIISCEHRKLKLEGLFDDLRLAYPGKRVIHFGDSYINDCVCAEMASIDSFLIPLEAAR